MTLQFFCCLQKNKITLAIPGRWRKKSKLSGEQLRETTKGVLGIDSAATDD
jgi:hypothetical protein